MWPNYSCCDFCPLDSTECEGCKARDAEVRLNRFMASLEPEPYDPWDDVADQSDTEGGDQDG